jgi:hypothetical protein
LITAPDAELMFLALHVIVIMSALAFIRLPKINFYCANMFTSYVGQGL